MSPVPRGERTRKSRELLSDGVRRRILQAILDGTLVSGERLHDEELIAWLGVSRTPIRSALERLAEGGLVEMEPNRFTRVARPTAEDLVDALEIYACLHGAAAEAVVPGLSAAEVERFREKALGLAVLAAPWAELAGAPETDVTGAGELGATAPGGRVWSPAELTAVNDVIGFFTRCTGNAVLISTLAEIDMRLVFTFRSLGVPLVAGDLDELVRGLVAGTEARDGDAVASALSDFLTRKLVAAMGVGARD